MINISKVNLTPQEPGIYFLYSKRKKLVYIGMARNLKLRLVSHKRSWLNTLNFVKNKECLNHDIRSTKPFEYFRYVIVKSSIKEIREFERLLINEYKPSYNDGCLFDNYYKPRWTNIVKDYFKK